MVLKRVEEADADALRELTQSKAVYRYLPTFLFEQKYADVHTVIRKLYDEALEESLILGIFLQDRFSGLAEMYGYRAPIRKISVGYRLLPQYWGQGLATETLRLMVDHLYREKGIEIVTASTMVENRASAKVLEKNGFALVVSGAPEDWGYELPTPADKWIR